MKGDEDLIGPSLTDSARVVGAYRWIEFRLFEVLGSWVPNESAPEVRILFDAHSRIHAWHAELWAERIPSVAGLVDRDSVTVAPSEAAEELMSNLGGAHDGELGGGTLLRLVGMSRVVSPRLVSGYRLHLRRAVAVSDAPVIRALHLVIRDEIEAWQEVETIVQRLIRRPHDVAVVTAHQQYLESLIVGTGPGLVPWPEEADP